MPVYEYECGKCGVRVEEIQKFSDAPLKKHSGCGGRLKRMLSAPAFQFKGSGWYVTDYARKGASSEGAKEAKEAKEAKADKKAEAKTDTKTDTTPAKKDDSASKPKETATKS